MKRTTMVSGLAVLTIFTLTGCGNSHSTSGAGDSYVKTANQSATSANNTPPVVTNKTAPTTTGTSSATAAVSITSHSSGTKVVEFHQFAPTIKQLLTNPQNAPMDCSALVQYVYAQAGFKIPRTVSQQATVGTRVSSKNQLQYGDIVFFDLSSKPNVATFDGIYVGNGQFVAKTTNKIMSIDINSTYWQDKFVFGQHI